MVVSCNNMEVVNTYPLSNYTFGVKEPKMEKDTSVADRLARMKQNYYKEGMRTSVEAILLVQEHNHPHILLLQIGNTFCKLPGGRLKPGENEIEGLKRKLSSKLAVSSSSFQPNWQIGECVGVWYRPNFETIMYPYCPPHITKPKECKKLFLVHLSEKEYFAVPKNLKLLAVPLFELYDNVQAMAGMMEESTTKMLEKWNQNLQKGENEIDMEEEITQNAAEIMGKVTFGSINDEDGKTLLQKLQQVQARLFKTNRLVGVPYSGYIRDPKTERETKRLGKEIDQLVHSLIESRPVHHGLLGLLLAGKEVDSTCSKLSREELVGECKTFFFAGHETTALALTWTLLMLALYPQWQDVLRKEIDEVCQGEALDATMLPKLKKMNMVLNEVLRLYGPSPNTQRQAREDVQVGNTVIPKGTNMWIDTVAMHHDESLWGPDVYEFKPERFETSGLQGACKHRLGFVPFGLGTRLCIGKNLTIAEYKIVLSSIIRRYGLSVSEKYVHSPKVMLTLRPSHGVQLVLHPLY